MIKETWRYKANGKSKHLIPDDTPTTAICGTAELMAHFWRGTGTQEEYETVEVLPKCKNCLKSLGRA